MLYKYANDEFIYPLASMSAYRESDDVLFGLSADHRALIEGYISDNPETSGVIRRLCEYVTPLLRNGDEEPVLIQILTELMSFNETKRLVTVEQYNDKFTRVLIKTISTVFNYNVYAMTSGGRLDAEEKHWDSSTSSLRDWIIEKKVNKLSIQYIPIQTNLTRVELGSIASRFVLDNAQLDNTVETFLSLSHQHRSTLYRYTSSSVFPQYSPDNAELLCKAKRQHAGILPLSEALLGFIGTELKVDGTPLVDVIMSEALTHFYSVRDNYGASYAYLLLIQSVVSHLERVLMYKVYDSTGEVKWRPYSMSFTDFRAQVGEGELVIEVMDYEPKDVTSQAVMMLLPMVLSRKDMATLTLPIPGCNATRRGGSVISESAMEYQ